MSNDVILTDDLKEHLDQFSLENLPKFSRGKVGRLYKQAMAHILTHLAAYPMRDGKPEVATLTITIPIRTVMEKVKTPFETSFGTQEVDVPKLKGLIASVKVKAGIEALESDDVRMATEIRNGRITDVRFNSEDNDNPLSYDQTKFPFDSDAVDELDK